MTEIAARNVIRGTSSSVSKDTDRHATESSSMKNGICVNCDSRKILGNVALVDTLNRRNISDDPSISLGVQKAPNAALFKQLVSAKVRAWVCEDCEYTEFYTTNPERLGKAIDVARKQKFLSERRPFRVSPAAEDAGKPSFFTKKRLPRLR